MYYISRANKIIGVLLTNRNISGVIGHALELYRRLDEVRVTNYIWKVPLKEVNYIF
jgi:hypothetical protein